MRDRDVATIQRPHLLPVRQDHKKRLRGLGRGEQAEVPGDKKYYDPLPPLLGKQCLKTIYACHKCSGTVDAGDLDRNGETTVLEIDAFIGWGDGENGARGLTLWPFFRQP